MGKLACRWEYRVFICSMVSNVPGRCWRPTAGPDASGGDTCWRASVTGGEIGRWGSLGDSDTGERLRFGLECRICAAAARKAAWITLPSRGDVCLLVREINSGRDWLRWTLGT